MSRPSSRGGAPAKRLSRDCAYCGAREGLIILGARAASLLSVALGQVCGSRYNDDRKVIAFSDNVQDAAHRGGFFSARTWRNSVRAAVAQVVAAHDGIALADLPARVEAWWSDPEANPGAFDTERFVSEFIAPDRQWLRDFTALQREGRLPAGSDLPALVARRLRWDTLAELGYGSASGARWSGRAPPRWAWTGTHWNGRAARPVFPADLSGASGGGGRRDGLEPCKRVPPPR